MGEEGGGSARAILMVAGEPSGDRHGADLADAVKAALPGVRLWGMGGDHMARAGVELLVDMRRVAVVGIVEVLSHMAAILQARRTLLRAITQAPPALCILIDFPDFNLWLARAVRRRGIPILYYISPQVWAWRRGRLRLMARLLDRMAVILPFEEPLLRRAGIRARYVGHPLLEQVDTGTSAPIALASLGLPAGAGVLGLLPGSRPREVESILPVMLEGARRAMAVIPEIQPVVALSSLVSKEEAAAAVRASGIPVRVVEGQAHRVIGASRVVVVASGTATLETALLEVPMVVVYRASWISYLLGRLLVKVPHIALVNILAGEEVVPELLQGALTPEAICGEIVRLWRDEGDRRRMIRGLRGVKARLGHQRASQGAAAMVLEMIGPAHGGVDVTGR